MESQPNQGEKFESPKRNIPTATIRRLSINYITIYINDGWVLKKPYHIY